MFNIILFGPPGAGKGTQAALLREKYGFNHISTGEIIRSEITAGTPCGREAQSFIERGELAPDGMVIDMVAEFIENHKENAGNIFDGFPRTTVQAEEFDRIMARHGIPVDMMISLEVPEEELIRRLLARGAESGRADDFSEEVIRNRIAVYHRRTEVVSNHYRALGKFVPVDGQGSVAEIFSRLSEAIDSRMG